MTSFGNPPKFESDVANSFMLDYVLFMSKVEAAKKGWDKTPKDKQRLKDRLSLFGFEERYTKGDGNCQFYAVSDQIYGDDKHAWNIRQNAVRWLRLNKNWNPNKQKDGELCKFSMMNWDKYCDKMAKNREWGDHLTLIAIAEVYNVSIRIISSVPGPQFMTEINPQAKEKHHAGRSRTIFIAHHLEYHYISIKESSNVFLSIAAFNAIPKFNTSNSSNSSGAGAGKQDSSSSLLSSHGNANVTIKIKNCVSGDTRRYSLGEWPQLIGIDKLLTAAWGNELPKPYTLKYLDEDNDEVVISTTPELKEAIRFAEQINPSRPVLTLLIKGPSASATQLLKQIQSKPSSTINSSVLKIPSSFEANVRKIIRLGYTDVSKVVDCLINSGNNIELAIDALQSQPKHSPPQNVDKIPVELSPKWYDLLHQLEDMGFSDLNENLESLIIKGGNVNEAALYLTTNEKSLLNDLIDG